MQKIMKFQLSTRHLRNLYDISEKKTRLPIIFSFLWTDVVVDTVVVVSGSVVCNVACGISGWVLNA